MLFINKKLSENSQKGNQNHKKGKRKKEKGYSENIKGKISKIILVQKWVIGKVTYFGQTVSSKKKMRRSR